MRSKHRTSEIVHAPKWRVRVRGPFGIEELEYRAHNEKGLWLQFSGDRPGVQWISAEQIQDTKP